MNMLHTEGEISQTGKYKDGVYFRLNKNGRDIVNDRTEEIDIATRLLFISSNKNFAASKQELRNDIVKGKDNYPRTVVGVLKYLQFHSLYVDTLNVTPVLSGNKKHLEIAFVTDGDEMPGEDKRQKSRLCCLWKNGECEYKKEHMRSECPRNDYSRNNGKKYNEKGELILCTVEEFEEDLTYIDEDLRAGYLVNNEDKMNNGFKFYSPLVPNYSISEYSTNKYTGRADSKITIITVNLI